MKGMSDVFKKYGSVEKVGERTCEQCGSLVPIYKRNGNEYSHCLNCDNEKLKSDMESFRKKREVKAVTRLIEKYEILPYKNSVTFDDYVPETKSQHNAKEITMSFPDIKETTLFFQGKPGLGKTHLSYCIAEKKKYEGKSVLFIDMPGLTATLRNSFNYNSIFSQEELMRLIDDVHLLILDDLGAEYVKSDNGMESWVSDILYQIVNMRQGKLNIYTTNYKGKELQQKYGLMSGRIISRMMSNAKIIKLDGDDHRLKGLN